LIDLPAIIYRGQQKEFTVPLIRVELSAQRDRISTLGDD